MNRLLTILLAASFAFTAMAALADRDACQEVAPPGGVDGVAAACVPAAPLRV